MGRAERELEVLKIRQKHLIKAIDHTEQYLIKLLHNITEIIEHYKEKQWQPNQNYKKWAEELQLEVATIKRQKILYKEEVQKTIDNLIPLDEF